MMMSPNYPKFRVNLGLFKKKKFMLDRGGRGYFKVNKNDDVTIS